MPGLFDKASFEEEFVMKELDVYKRQHQEDALMDLAVGDSVILGTPTGSGKSMVALGLCFMAVLYVLGSLVVLIMNCLLYTSRCV